MDLSSGSSWGCGGDAARLGHVYSALFAVTGLGAYSATSGSPLLYNGTASTSRVLAVLLGLSVGWTTAPGASGVVGIGIGSTAAPTTTTGVTAVTNTNFTGGAPQCLPLNAGTVTAATGFLATHQVSTSTSQPSAPVWQPLDGIIVIPPGGFVNVSGAAAITTMVAKITLVWAEIPI